MVVRPLDHTLDIWSNFVKRKIQILPPFFLWPGYWPVIRSVICLAILQVIRRVMSGYLASYSLDYPVLSSLTI